MSKPSALLTFASFAGSVALASTFTQATSTVGSLATCTQTGSNTASCSQSQGFDSVSSSATSNISSTSGLLDVIVNAAHTAGGFNSIPSGSASASFNVPLIVTGGAGTGTLTADFFGFDDNTASGPAGPNPVLSVTLGSTVSTFTPSGGGSTFSFATPFTFGVPLTFQASISGSTQVPLLMANAASNANLEGRVSITGFTLTTAGGQPLGGTVSVVPEPSTAGLLAFLFAAAAVAVKRNRVVR